MSPQNFKKQIAEEYTQYDIVFIKFKIKQKKQCLGTHTSMIKTRSKARKFRKTGLGGGKDMGSERSTQDVE